MSEAFNGDPWTIKTEMKLRTHPDVWFISLLTDEAGAALIARGIVPQYVRQQAADALEWSGTVDRAPAHERSLFEPEPEVKVPHD